MKTIREWFEGLPDPFREQALSEAHLIRHHWNADTMAQALHWAFLDHPQRTIDYWRVIVLMLDSQQALRDALPFVLADKGSPVASKALATRIRALLNEQKEGE